MYRFQQHDRETVSEEIADKLINLQWLFFDFDGVLTDNAVWVDQNGIEQVRCSRLDGIGLSGIRRKGINTAIVSTEKNPVVSVRAKKLNMDCFQAITDKRSWLQSFIEEHKIDQARTAFMGNDVNDLGALEFCDLAIIVADAHPSLQAHADIVTNTCGGYGAVREICDLICQIRDEKAAG